MATTEHEISERLGGSAILGGEVDSGLDWIAVLAGGIPTHSLDRVVEAGLASPEEIDRLVIPRRTLAYRRQHGQPLTTEESDRLLQITRVATLAAEAFANSEKAHRWLRKPCRALAGAVPLELLGTATGAALVQEELVRIQHGILA